MSTAVETTISTTPDTTYLVEGVYPNFTVAVNGVTLRDRNGNIRFFSASSSARKTITRLKRPAGDRHR